MGIAEVAGCKAAGRSKGGFTMVETMTVVAITIVLLGVGFVALWQIWLSMHQLEMNAAAKEIYVAAQNHLITAESEGMLDTGALNAPERQKGTPVEGEEGVFYFTCNPGSVQDGEDANNPDNPMSLLHMMLPFGSIDDSLRRGGTYVVVYQPSSAKVMDVFYRSIDDSKDSGFEEGAYSNGLKELGKEMDGLRRYNGKIVGWYGGEPDDPTPIRPDAPTIEVDNGDFLQVKTDNSANQDKYGTGDKLTLKTMLVVEGEKSTAKKRFMLGNNADGAADDNAAVNAAGDASDEAALIDEANRGIWSTVLDSVVTEKGNFGLLFETGEEGEAIQDGNWNGVPFIPGENLKVTASTWVEKSGEGFRPSIIAKSATFTTNSLFGDASSYPEDEASASGASKANAAGGDADGALGTVNAQAIEEEIASAVAGSGAGSGNKAYNARISSFRHLANLSKAVSGFDAKADFGCDTIAATQETDLDWAKFPSLRAEEPAEQGQDSQEGGDQASESAGAGVSQEKQAVSIRTTDELASKAGSFLPVNVSSGAESEAAATLEYDGRGHWISGLRVDAADDKGKLSDGADAGLFGSLHTGSSVGNLVLVNPKVTAAPSGNAGALAGKADGTAVNNVLVREDLSTTADTEGRLSGIDGATAGGLVGSMADGSVDGCAAAVWVSASGGNAGGLIGSAENVTIADSYSGGHTADGGYMDDANVTATVAAGGLVGSFSGASSIENCYSTCSVYGNTAGGLMGAFNSGYASNVYAVGKVAAPEGGSAGALVGTGSGSLSEARYLRIANGPEVNPVGSDADATGVAADDADTDGYVAFAPMSGDSVPYDSKLAEYYQGKYAFQTIAQLKGEQPAEGDLKGVHYGDWPSFETMVVNRKAS